MHEQKHLFQTRLLFISSILILFFGIGDSASKVNEPVSKVIHPQYKDRDELLQSFIDGAKYIDNAEESSVVQKVPLKINITHLYEICKSYVKSNLSQDVLDEEIEKVLPFDQMDQKDQTGIREGIENSCRVYFINFDKKASSPPPITSLVGEHKIKRDTTTHVPSPLPPYYKGKDRNQFIKSEMLGKPVNKQFKVNSKQTNTTDDNVPLVFPTNVNSEVTINGTNPVNTLPKETIAEDTFPTETSMHPIYDLNIIKSKTKNIQSKLDTLLDNIDSVRDKNNTHYEDFNDTIVKIINELKILFENWTENIEIEEHGNHNDTIIFPHNNETNSNGTDAALKTKLLRSKLMLIDITHNLMELNKSSNLDELACKMSYLYDEISNITKIDLNLSIDIDTDHYRNCTQYKFNCTENRNKTSSKLTIDTTMKPIDKVEDDNLNFQPNAFSTLAICFAIVAIVSYIGLVLWRYILEKRYGNRQLLSNDDADFYDSAPEGTPIVIRSEQL